MPRLAGTVPSDDVSGNRGGKAMADALQETAFVRTGVQHPPIACCPTPVVGQLCGVKA